MSESTPLVNTRGDAPDLFIETQTVCPVHERFVPCRPCLRASERGTEDNHADLWTDDPEAVAKVRSRHGLD